MAGSNTEKPPNHAAAVSAFNCPACGGNINLTARGTSVSVYCTHCGAAIDANSENFKIISRAKGIEHASAKPLITIGTRGKLQGIEWEVIGFMQRSDKTGRYKWQEYLLFNPSKGFRWLIENRGHWTLFRKIEQASTSQPATVGSQITKLRYDKRTFDVFERGDAVVRAVLGEFYWRVKRGDTTRIADLICPPHMLSHEITSSDAGKESIWSLGEYVEPATIKQAFAIDEDLPMRYGPGPAQPNTRRGHFHFGVIVAVLCSILMLIGKAGIGGMHPEKTVYSVRLGYDDNGKTVVSDPFQVNGPTALRLEVLASVNNTWAEVDVELVNDDTGETRHVNTGVEYWSGRSSDGYYWHEGSTRKTAIIAPVSKGTWHINTDYAIGKSLQQDARNVVTQLEVVEGVQGWSNLMLALIALWTPTLMLGVGAVMFDMNRWSLSDYSPYHEFMESLEHAGGE